MEEGKAVQPELFKWGKAFVAKNFQIWRDNGGRFNYLPDAERKEMLKKFSAVGGQVLKNNPSVKKVYDLLVDATKKTAQ
jgi:hypothetical protein